VRNARALIMIVIALFTGMAAVFFASSWLLNKSNTGNKIAVAVTDISLGQPVTSQMIKLVDWPSNSTPEGAFSDPGKIEGRVLKTSITRGEPLMESKLAPVGTKGGLSAVIGEGKRAITVRVNDVIGVAGFALPGNFVDIIVSTQKDGRQANDKSLSISKIVLERILVLAVAQEVNRDETKPRVVNAVTLEVSPIQAEKIDVARSVGTLSLALRNQIDLDRNTTSGATKLTLLNEKDEVSLPAAPRKILTKAKARARPVSKASLTCVGVIAGLRGSQECY
jgi:pilus assembly protein CpaB